MAAHGQEVGVSKAFEIEMEERGLEVARPKESEQPIAEMCVLFDKLNERLLQEITHLESVLKGALSPAYFREADCKDVLEPSRGGEWCELALSLEAKNKKLKYSIDRIIDLRELTQL